MYAVAEKTGTRSLAGSWPSHLTASGAYDEAAFAERRSLETDENGMATTSTSNDPVIKQLICSSLVPSSPKLDWGGGGVTPTKARGTACYMFPILRQVYGPTNTFVPWCGAWNGCGAVRQEGSAAASTVRFEFGS